MIRSRVTLATMDAAAIERHVASPRTTAVAGQASFGTRLPSIRVCAGATGSASTARAMASMVASRMLSRSTSPTLAQPTPVQATASNRAMRSFRRAGESFFESSRPSGIFRGSRITAAATTGPAHDPRPASSTPATGCGNRPSRARSGTGFIVPLVLERRRTLAATDGGMRPAHP